MNKIKEFMAKRKKSLIMALIAAALTGGLSLAPEAASVVSAAVYAVCCEDAPAAP